MLEHRLGAHLVPCTLEWGMVSQTKTVWGICLVPLNEDRVHIPSKKQVPCTLERSLGAQFVPCTFEWGMVSQTKTVLGICSLYPWMRIGFTYQAKSRSLVCLNADWGHNLFLAPLNEERYHKKVLGICSLYPWMRIGFTYQAKSRSLVCLNADWGQNLFLAPLNEEWYVLCMYCTRIPHVSLHKRW